MKPLSNFEKEVLKEFGFLLENGFIVAEYGVTIVSFRSDLYFIHVFWGPRSKEIGIETGSMSTYPAKAYSFSILVSVFDKQAGYDWPLDESIIDEAAMRERVRFLSASFRHYVDLEAFKSPELLERLKANGREMADARFPPLSIEELDLRFYRMWEDRDYAALVNLFWTLRRHLKKDQQEKLDIAKTKISSQKS